MPGTNLETTKSEASVASALEAALQLFSSQGFGATSMRQIAAPSGLSVGNLYHHFASKEEIFQRLLDQYWEKVLDPALRLNRVFAQPTFPKTSRRWPPRSRRSSRSSRPTSC